MKKIYTLLFVCGFTAMTSFVHAQVNQVRSQVQNTMGSIPYATKDKSMLSSDPIASQQSSTSQTKAAPFFTDNFSTAANWTVTGTGTATWVVSNAGTGITAANKLGAAFGAYAWINSDAAGAGAYDRSIESANNINCAGHSYISLSFVQSYTKFQDVTQVFISNNGGSSWTAFPIPENDDVAPNGSSVNPQTIKINISSIAANSATVKIRFNIAGDYDYWWSVDDVALTDIDQYDIAASGNCFMTQWYTAGYSKVPYSQRDSIAFGMDIYNNGYATQDITYRASVNGGQYYDNSVTYTGFTGLIHDTAYASGAAADRYFPVSIGTHNVKNEISSANPDINPADNVAPARSFDVTDTVYARDNGKFNYAYFGYRTNGTTYGGFYDKFPYLMGSSFRIKNAVSASSVTFAVSATATASVAGAKLRVRILKFNGTNWVDEGTPSGIKLFVAATDRPTTLNPVDKWITIPFASPISLIAGTTYMVCVERMVQNTADSTKYCRLAAADNAFLDNKLFATDSQIGYDNSMFVFGLANGSTTYSTLPYTLNGIQASIRLNTAPTCTKLAYTPTTVAPCPGGTNGSVSLAITNGVGAIGYLWSNGSTVASSTGLAAGDHFCEITDSDASRCPVMAKFTLTASAGLTSTISPTNQICATKGLALVTPTTGSAPYTYTWSTSPAQTNQTATGLNPGSYTVSFADATGCTGTKTATITATTPAITSTTSNTAANCGLANGTVTANPTSGTAPYTYSWSSIPIQNTATAIGLAVGSYTVTIGDANGCSGTNTAAVAAGAAAPTVTVTTNASTGCGASFGDATATPTGTGPFTYAWSNGGTPATIAGLAAGNYNVTVTDNVTSCTGTGVGSVSDAGAPVLGFNNITGLTCAGTNNGSATITTAGLTGYTISWNGSVGTATANNLMAGTNTVSITNGSCSASGSVVISSPAALVAAASTTTNVSCFGATTGAANVNASGGTGAYSYAWSPSGNTTAAINGIGAATHNVTVTDANGCKATSNTIVTGPASGMTTSYGTVSNVTCFGLTNGAVNLNASGGATPYNFTWSNGKTTQSISGLAGGSYSVAVSDANGCAPTTLGSATVTAPTAALAIASTAATNWTVMPNDATLTVNIVGGTPPFTVSSTPASGATWSFSGGTATGTNVNAATGNGTSYSLIVTDSKGCVSASSSRVVKKTVGLKEESKFMTNLNAYPNPTNSDLTISFSTVKSVSMEVKLVNVNGQIVFSENLGQHNGEYKKTIDLTDNAKGVYFLQIVSEKEVVTKKVILY